MRSATSEDDVSVARARETSWERFARVLRAELALYPGRSKLILRSVLACTVVMIIIMVFRIPGAALGAYYPLLLTRHSPRSTARAALRTGVVCSLGTAEIVLGAMLFAGSPFLHFLWVAGTLFAVFYLISTFTLYDSALALGLIVTSGITTWDLPVSADVRLRQTLFTLLSILIGCAVAVAIEYLFSHTHSPDIVLEGIQQRLEIVSRLLKAYEEGNRDVRPLRPQLASAATRGAGHLRERLAHSNYERRYKEQLSAAVALTERVVELASGLAELNPAMSEADRNRCASIRANIDAIDAHLAREESPGWIDLSECSGCTIPLLVELERNVDLIAQSLTDQDAVAHVHLPEPGEEPRLPSFVADAFTSREHLRFAIRGTLSAMACYLIYMSVGWTGLSASIATCVLTALSNTGASRHKQLMRFAGVILGACVLGFGTQALILPQIDSLFSFTIIFAAVIALGAWVASSGPRIAFAGAQIVLAYDLVNLNHFTITTSLVPARDTVLGIMLGILAMWLIFDHLWAAPAHRSLRALLIGTAKAIAALEFGTRGPEGKPVQQVIAEAEAIEKRLDQLRSLVDASMFEPYPREKDEAFARACVRALGPHLRSLVLVNTGLLQHGSAALSPGVEAAAKEAQRISCMLLKDSIRMLESGSPAPVSAFEDLPRGPANVPASLDPQGSTKLRLAHSLVQIAQQIRDETAQLVAAA